MDTLLFLASIPVIGMVVALYLDYRKPERLLKEEKQWENILGKQFNLEDLMIHHIDNFGKGYTKEHFNRMVVFMNNIGRDTSNSEYLYKRHLN